MARWTNNDGLNVKFGRSEAVKAAGGEVALYGNRHQVEFTVSYTDLLSATATLFTAGNSDADGVLIPKGARIEAVEFVSVAPFTSSGTVASATLVMGLKKADRSTELDHDGFTTTSFVLAVLDATGDRVYVVPGVTGAGDEYGTTLAENGLISVYNSAHASHPLTGGSVKVRVFYTYL